MDNNISGIEFEKICQVLVEKMGFTAEITKASGDGGIDIIAYNHQPLLSGKYIIQCKRYSGSVGEPIIRDLYGVVTSERANKGILMTTGSFTKQAIAFAEGKPIELINGDMLHDLILKYVFNDKILSEQNLVQGYLVDTQIIKLSPSFSPLKDKDMHYLHFDSRLALNPNDLTIISNLIEFLQDFTFNYGKSQWECEFSDEDVYNNKFDALTKIILIAETLESNNFLYPEYLSIVAQTYFLLGYWKIALQMYEKILRLPGVLHDVQYSRTNYRGELELACKIIHNICVIYVCMDEANKAKEFKRQHKNIFDLELQRALKNMRENIEEQRRYEEKWEKLDDVFDKKYYYFDNLYDLSHFQRYSGVLNGINSFCRRTGKPHDITLLDDSFRIIKKNNNTITLIDTYKNSNVLEIIYQPYNKVQFSY